MGNSFGRYATTPKPSFDFCLYGRVVTLSIEYYEKNSYKAAEQAQKFCNFINKVKEMCVLEEVLSTVDKELINFILVIVIIIIRNENRYQVNLLSLFFSCFRRMQ